MGSQALQHAVAACDWDLAVELVAEHWFDLFVRGQGSAIRRLVDVLPAERQRGDAELAAALACAAFEVGDAEAGAAHLEHARAAEAGLPAERRRRYLETLALARLYCARLDGDFETALEAADELLAEAAEHGAWSGDAREALVRASLGRAALWAHRLDRARVELEHAVSQARAAGLDYVAVSAQSALGLLAIMQHGPVAAPCAREAVELAGRRGWGTILETAGAHAALGDRRVLRPAPARGRASTSSRARDALSHGRTRHVEFMLDHLEARMAGRGRPSRARACASSRPSRSRTAAARRARTSPPRWRACARACTPPRATSRRRERGAGAAARRRVARRRGHRRPAAARGRRPGGRDRDARAGARHGRERRAQRRAARAHGAGGDRARHRRRAGPGGRGDRARARAAPRRAGTAGRSSRAAAASRRCCARGSAAARRTARSRASCWRAFEERDHERRTVAPLLEPLSERECAILRYLPTTLSNREIAAELFVTTNTVKTHLRSIYRKLDVARRREAVERARDLRLLSTAGRR